jgi:hypothetical protein
MSLRYRFETQHLVSPEVVGWPAGTNIIIPNIPGKRIGIYSAILSAQNVTQFYLASTTGFPISGLIILPAGGPLVLDIQTNTDPWFLSPKDLGVAIIVTANAVFGDIYWMEVLD